METRVDSKIKKMLEPNSDGTVPGYEDNDITRAILHLDPENVPGVRVKTLSQLKRISDGGSWEEYLVLYEIDKYLDTSDYLSHVFKCLGKVMSSLSRLKIDSIGIEEVACDYSDYYYVLIYILSDGKSYKESKENYHIDGGGYCI